jgi:hypothetical protein
MEWAEHEKDGGEGEVIYQLLLRSPGNVEQ